MTGPLDPEIVPPEPLLFEDAEPQLFDRPDPPPSKAEFELALGHGIISGLTPGVLISVEPSGMPPRPDELELSEESPEDGAPSGEVGPMPGVVVVCACAATIPIQQPMAANSKSGCRIERPQSSVADVFLTRPAKLKAQRLSLCGSGVPPFSTQNTATPSWFRCAQRDLWRCKNQRLAAGPISF
jgi:hypothetical protein